MKMSMTRSASPMTPFTAWPPMCSQQARNARMTWPPDLRRGWCLLMARRKIRKPRSEATRCREMDVNGERLPSVNFSRPKTSSTSIRPEDAHFGNGAAGSFRDKVRVTSLSVHVAPQKRACEHQCGSRLGLSGMVNKGEHSVNRRQCAERHVRHDRDRPTRPSGCPDCRGERGGAPASGRAKLQDRQPGADLRVARMPWRGFKKEHGMQTRG